MIPGGTRSAHRGWELRMGWFCASWRFIQIGACLAVHCCNTFYRMYLVKYLYISCCLSSYCHTLFVEWCRKL